MAKRESRRFTDVGWDRARAIFGNPRPPKEVWESQFDYFDEALQRLGTTPYEEIDFGDLWYYHHDLCYVNPLQPDLFSYLFPACLMDWHESLMRNTSCSHGDSEFHRSIVTGQIWERMLTPQQAQEIQLFLRDSMLIRLDAERGFQHSLGGTPAYGWMGRLNSLGLAIPFIEPLWIPWWSMETPGRAVSVLQYCSGLIYFDGENPVFDTWSPERGGGGPYLWENDSQLPDAGWLEVNLDFLRKTLSVGYILKHAQAAASRLAGEPEEALARRIANDSLEKGELIESRLDELPVLLGGKRPNGIAGWSI